MNGFERTDGSAAWTTRDRDHFPDDFSHEEAEFASELRELFSIEHEDAPPLYTQTLLEDERSAPIEPCFDTKLTYRVFRRLRLKRRPLVERGRIAFLWNDVCDTLAHVSGLVAASFSAVLMLMIFTVVLATPSFAEGVRIILGQTGVVQVHNLPANIHTPKPDSSNDMDSPPQFDPTMPLSWLGQANGDYVYQGTRLIPPDPQHPWSKGAIVDIQYQLATAHVGTGLLDIREFQVNPQYAAVLQVVGDGSAYPVNIGTIPAVYVDGTWMESQRARQWQPGVRSNLIFEQPNGVVFWIAGDQRDGMGQNELIRLANQLTSTTAAILQTPRLSVRLVGESLAISFEQPVGTEFLQLVPVGASPETGAGEFVQVVTAPEIPSIQ